VQRATADRVVVGLRKRFAAELTACPRRPASKKHGMRGDAVTYRSTAAL
jgi:hypothetical protein